MKRGIPDPEDWITFLSCNINNNVSLTAVLFSSVVLIAVIDLQLTLTGYLNVITSFPFYILGASFLIQFFRGAKASRNYQKLLHKIMIGEIKEHRDILREYQSFTIFSKKNNKL